jgi:DNA polymerase-3 subunit epsilon
MKNRVWVLDLETTDFFNRGGLIVEVGMVLLDLATGRMQKGCDMLVKPDGFNEGHKESWIFSNSNLEYKSVVEAEPLDIAKLQSFFDKEPRVVAWNTAFDFAFLRQQGLRFTELPCPMKQSTDYFGIRTMRGFKWPTVQEAWDRLFPDRPYVESHRGFDDAAHEAMIIHELYKRGVWKPE